MHIVLAEDDTDDRDIFDEVLHDLNLPVSTTFVDNGEELLFYLNGVLKLKPIELPQLIVMDVNMPRMDGKEALKRIKETEILKLIPVITLTTSTDEKLKQEMEQLGSCGFYSKPTSEKDYKKIVIEMLRTCLPDNF